MSSSGTTKSTSLYVESLLRKLGALLGGLDRVAVDARDVDRLGTCFCESEKNCLMLNLSDDFPSEVVVGDTAFDGFLLLAGRSG